MNSRFLNKVSQLAEKYIFPPSIYCISCGAIIDDTRCYSLCDSCMHEFKWITGATCKVCGKSLGHEITAAYQRQAAAQSNPAPEEQPPAPAPVSAHAPAPAPSIPLPDTCYDCLSVAHVFDCGFSCFGYGSREKAPILKLKYAEAGYVAKFLGKIMFDRLCQILEEEYGGEIPFDVIVPVPIHKSRLAKRGYNQAELIGEELSRLLGIPQNPGLIERTKATVKMNGLDTVGRSSNIEDAFQPTSQGQALLPGQSVLIVDDIYTTGSTADAVATALKKAGAEKVYLITLASGSNYLRSGLEG